MKGPITALLLIMFSCAAWAQVFQCKLKNGKVEFRDYPCESESRPPTPQKQSPQPRTLNNNSTDSRLSRSASSSSQLDRMDAAISTCSRLLTEYDTEVPFKKCRPGDSTCIRTALQEALLIEQRLLTHPDWTRYRCGNLSKSIFESPSGSCVDSQIVKPVPFLGKGDEVIVLSDGSTWKDNSYKYLYLYAYSPAVKICTAESKMILEHGGATHTFSLTRIR